MDEDNDEGGRQRRGTMTMTRDDDDDDDGRRTATTSVDTLTSVDTDGNDGGSSRSSRCDASRAPGTFFFFSFHFNILTLFYVDCIYGHLTQLSTQRRTQRQQRVLETRQTCLEPR